MPGRFLCCEVDKRAMGLEKPIRELYFQKQKLDRIIAELEELHRTDGGSPVAASKPKRRVRKQMNELERKEVSERMKAYWQKQRKTS